MPAELDVFGCTAPPCEVLVPAGEALAAVLGWAGAAHPVQTVAAEWCAPLAWSAPWTRAWKDHGSRVVHAWHELVLHRELRLPVRCELSAEVVSQRPTRAGALTVVRYRATTSDGPLWTTHAGVLWRGLSTVERGRCDEPRHVAPVGETVQVAVAADFAHRYSEASGIWNPVHTDPEAARAAGLDAPILHGSATMGLALTAVLERLGAVTHVSARFVAPVTLPDVLTVSIAGPQVAVRRGDGTVVVTLDCRDRTC